jgi:large subunit ribosomal protein L9
MKIILKEEVDNLGLAGDVVDVADGYGRNFLIPRGKAILATPGAMKEAEALLRSRKAHESATLGDAEAMKDILESRTLKIPARVDERGHLYGSVSATDVHRVLKERGHDIERKRVDLKGTIKEIGIYEVPVHVHPQVVATIEVEVVDEEGKVLKAGEQVEPDVDAEAVTDAAAEVAEGSVTDVDALAEQALEAAKEFEAQRLAAEAEQAEAAGETDAPSATEDESATDEEPVAEDA